jgi:hypothetical protein
LPRIRFSDLPPAVFAHLKQRVLERKITISDLQRLETWRASEPEAPPGRWYKDFGSFMLCGEGELPKTVLTRDMEANGVKL